MDKKKIIFRQIWRSRFTYLFILPGIIYFLLFYYSPMYGLLMAFKNYNARLGILNSEWVGLTYFQRLFITPLAVKSISNTLKISVCRLILEFPVPIIIAILLNEMRGKRLNRIYQTAFTLPHFLSWVIVSTILKNFFANSGAVNYLLQSAGIEKINFLSSPNVFFGMIFLTANWKEAGWSAIIYLAAISGINPELYEAAIVDGASRFRRIWHITLPSIKSVITILFILAIGNAMNGGFDQIFNMRNPVVTDISNIIDTYVYDITFLAVPNYGFSTAVGMFKSIINSILLLCANFIALKVIGQGLFGVRRVK
jgi:putative aldouronate transport system permease protein